MDKQEELRHLLENAAKACGKEVQWVAGQFYDDDLLVDGKLWSPELPGTDSQVLAAELGIDTCWNNHPLDAEVTCFTFHQNIIESYADPPSKSHAQSMAVLRVAAAIGEAMP